MEWRIQIKTAFEPHLNILHTNTNCEEKVTNCNNSRKVIHSAGQKKQQHTSPALHTWDNTIYTRLEMKAERIHTFQHLDNESLSSLSLINNTRMTPLWPGLMVPVMQGDVSSAVVTRDVTTSVRGMYKLRRGRGVYFARLLLRMARDLVTCSGKALGTSELLLMFFAGLFVTCITTWT